jgi:nucleoside-diphosphate-sugar epimerase
MRILIIGGAGYVGSVLTHELLERGYTVRVFDRLFFGKRGISDIEDRIDLMVGDVRDIPDAAYDDVEAVVNLGGLSNDPTAEYNPKANTEMNTVATRKSAEAAIRMGIDRYVFASSCSVYYSAAGNEKEDFLLNEDSKIDPKAAYSRSKFEGERELLALAEKHPSFCPVMLRKGTVFGFSRRMRYDLVVNTFIKDALRSGRINLHLGGEMWRPLVEVRDAARAYIAALQADAPAVRAQIFNVAYKNFRISELALRTREALRAHGVAVDLFPDFQYKGVRSYRVDTDKIRRVLGFEPAVTVEEAVGNIVAEIRANGMTDYDNPIYYNISWMKLLEESERIIGVTGKVF